MACAMNLHQELYDYMKNWLSTEHNQLRVKLCQLFWEVAVASISENGCNLLLAMNRGSTKQWVDPESTKALKIVIVGVVTGRIKASD